MEIHQLLQSCYRVQTHGKDTLLSEHHHHHHRHHHVVMGFTEILYTVNKRHEIVS